MRVEIVVDPARAAAKQPLTARIAAAAPQAPANSRAAQSACVLPSFPPNSSSTR